MGYHKDVVWIVNPGGVVMSVPLEHWEGVPRVTKPLKDEKGFRLATDEEVSGFWAQYGAAPEKDKAKKPKKDE